ncbi:hypothetical protein BDW69DRAFT_12243 [Aspergillus filifer]
MNRCSESEQVGRRLVLTRIDSLAAEDPSKVAIYQAISFDPSIYFNVTYGQLSNILNRLAWWLAESLHGEASDITIAYLAPTDARHLLLTLAAVKTGSRLLHLSPRNSGPINEHLIKTAECPAIIYDLSFSAAVAGLATSAKVQAVQAPKIEDVLSDTSLANVYPYAATYSDASHKPIAVFHTSGSTGMPKPVNFTHAAVAATDNLRHFYSNDTYRVSAHRVLENARNIYNGFPLFHAAGLVLGCLTFLSGNTLVLGPANQPCSPQMVKDILSMAHPDGALVPPLVVEQISQEPAMVDEVSKLKFIAFGGGSTSKAAGDILAPKTIMMNLLGSSEAGMIGVFMTPREHWDWFHFAEDEMGITWDPIDDDKDVPEFYEMVIRRRIDLAQEQAVFANFPDLHEFYTKDIFRRHPTIPYYYKYQSRKDDVIVFSTGEKTNPIDLEGRISSLPGVGACLVIGHKRPYPILLIELVPTASSDEILPYVHQALEDLNKLSEKHAQIHRSDILIAVPEKPFARTPKGTIIRSQTNKLYEAEIEAMYSFATARPNPALQGLAELDASTNESLEHTIAAMVGGLTGVEALRVDDDFFTNGLDSRQVQIVATAVARALPQQKDMPFLRNAVYMNPTARKLVEYVRRDTAGNVSATATFDTLFDKYASALPHPPQAPSQPIRPADTTQHVLLTGSTGFVGTSILQTLLQRSDVTEITCIDRRIPATKVKDTIINESTPRVTRYVADLSQPRLGLPDQAYSHLVSTVTTIIHVQWPVTFNLPLPLFEPQLAGIVNLVQLACDSPRTPHVVFLSSIGTVLGWDKPAPVPETGLDDPRYAMGAYAESKLLASRLLDRAAAVSGVSSAICRVGQVAGSVKPSLHRTGIWPSRDWFPTLLRASQVMGILPQSLGSLNHVDWIPVDTLSESLATLALNLELQDKGANQAGAEYYHFTNPSAASYTELVPTIERRLGYARQEGSHGNERIKVVDTLAEWTERLASWTSPSSSATETTLAIGAEEAESTMTAAKALLEFYEGLAQGADKPSVVLDTTKTAGRIPALKDVGAVTGEWIDIWMDGWGL